MISRSLLTATAVAARNVMIGGSLAAIRLLNRPRDLVNHTSESLSLLRAYLGYRGVKQRHVHEAFEIRGPTAVTLIEPYSGSWAPPSPSYTVDLVALATFCRALEPSVIFEIGTSVGHTTTHFAMNSPDDAQVYTLDLPLGGGPSLRTTYVDARHIEASQHHERYVFEGTAGERKIRRLYGDSASFDFSPWYGRVDLFFIDGAHSYEYVRSDTENAVKCVRTGGVIAWHDFGRMGVNGVSRVVEELAAKGRAVYAVPGGSVAYTMVGG